MANIKSLDIEKLKPGAEVLVAVPCPCRIHMRKCGLSCATLRGNRDSDERFLGCTVVAANIPYVQLVASMYSDKDGGVSTDMRFVCDTRTVTFWSK